MRGTLRGVFSTVVRLYYESYCLYSLLERETDSYGVCGVARARRCGVGGDIGELARDRDKRKKKDTPPRPGSRYAAIAARRLRVL